MIGIVFGDLAFKIDTLVFPLPSSHLSPSSLCLSVSPMENSFCLGDGRGKVDPRLAEVVRYRLGRKESHSMAAGLLEEFLAPAAPIPAPAKTPGQEQEKELGEQVEEEAIVDGGGE